MPPDAPRLRDATEADIPAIARIYGREVEAGTATLEEAPPSEAEMMARMATVRGLSLPYLVAEREGAILGYSHAGAFHPFSAYRFIVQDTVYVDPAAQRQGIGKALLLALIERCADIGCRQMRAFIVAENQGSAALHATLGFQPAGIARSAGYKFGRWLDVAYMQRPLGAGDTAPPDRPAPGQLTH